MFEQLTNIIVQSSSFAFNVVRSLWMVLGIDVSVLLLSSLSVSIVIGALYYRNSSWFRFGGDN